MKKIKIDETKLGDFQYWKELFNTKEENFKKLKKETKHHLLRDAYLKAPDYVRLDKAFVMEGLTHSYFYLFDIDKQLKDKEYCIEYIEKNKHPFLYGIPEEYQEELFEKILLKNVWVVKDIFYEKHLFHLKTKENYIKWIQLNPKIYEELVKFQSLKNDFTLAEVAVQSDFKIIFNLTKAIARKIISRNVEMALEYMKKNIEIFTLLPLKIRNDKEFILENIKKLNYKCIPFIGNKALEHKEVIFAMNDFYQIESKLPENFFTDKEIAYHIIKKSGYIHNCFKDCENFTLVELVKDLLLETKSTYYYKTLTETQKRNPKIINALLDINYFKEEKKVEKQYNTYLYGYKNEYDYVDTSVVKLLPEDIQMELIKEFKETGEDDREPEELELLRFAQMKYLQLVLNKDMNESTNHPKRKI